MLRRAAIQADVELDLIKIVRQSSDHPMSLYFPEAAYLKSQLESIQKRLDEMDTKKN